MDNNSTHDFLTLGDLKTFNQKVDSAVFKNGTQQGGPADITPNSSKPINSDEQDNKKVEEDVPYDSNRFESNLVSPETIPDDVLYQLADIVDKKSYYNTTDDVDTDYEGPSSVDRLSSSIAIAFITEEGIPVAVGSVIDPTQENYKNIIPQNYYELRSGYPLSGRLQQEFFAVKPEYKSLGISGEIRGLLQNAAPSMYVVIPSNDKETLQGLEKNKYRLVAQFDTDWENVPVQLWIN